MINTKTIIKVCLTLVAIYLLIGVLSSIPFFVYSLIQLHNNETLIFNAVSLAVSLLYGYLVIHFLVIKRDWLADKLIPEPRESETTGSVDWVVLIFRVVVFVVGLMVMKRSIAYFFNLVTYLRLSHEESMYTQAQVWPLCLNSILAACFYLIVGIYLLYGAPHLVRWQVRKTEQLCRELED